MGDAAITRGPYGSSKQFFSLIFDKVVRVTSYARKAQL